MRYVLSNAYLDSTGSYRYVLSRVWREQAGKVVFVMLNPSTADGEVDDPTIRRCVRFTEDWGYGSLEVVNLFAVRSTDPKEILRHDEPVGAENDIYIQKAVSEADLVVAAWGTRGYWLQRDRMVFDLLKGKNVYCLSTTRDGYPRHPLYVRRGQNPILLKGRGGSM